MNSTRTVFLSASLAAVIALAGVALTTWPTPSAAQEERRSNVTVSATDVPASYANFCRVTGTPEEVILDFGLNTQPVGVPDGPIEVSNRIVMNYFTAKRMIAALQISIQRHERAFGEIETDVKKRVKQPSP